MSVNKNALISSQLKVGIIGCGAIALNKHIPAIVKNPNLRIHALCGHSEASAKAALKHCISDDPYICTDFMEILNDDSIDAVCICLPNSLHASVSIEALRHGKHVLCEKPMACSAEEAHRMLEAAEKYKRTLSIGFQNRWKDDALYLKELCRQGQLGTIYHVEAEYMRRRGLPTWGKFNDPSSGGALLDIGSHIIDLALWLMDELTAEIVFGRTYDLIMREGSDCNRWGKWETESRCEDSAFAFVQMRSGTTVTFNISWAANISTNEHMRITLLGSKAGAELSGDGLKITRENHGRIEEITPIPLEKFSGKYSPATYTETPAYREWQQFIADISLCHRGNAYQACAVSDIIQAIHDSSRQRSPIYL